MIPIPLPSTSPLAGWPELAVVHEILDGILVFVYELRAEVMPAVVAKVPPPPLFVVASAA
jgi:hypothetical protein